MNPLDEIRQRLAKYPDAIVEDTGSVITVKAANDSGFDVSCRGNNPEITIGLAGWHETFSDAETALSWFAFGLSQKCRLKVLSKGRMDYRWIVEELRDGKWHGLSETGLLIYPFLFPKKERILQNHLLPFPIP